MKRHTVLLLAAVVGAVAVAAQGAPAAKPLGPPGGLPPNLPKNGLVGFWTADGHAKDSMGKHHGTLHGNVKYTAGRHGKANGAFLFNGKSGFVKIPDRPELDTDLAFTLSAWVNPTAYQDSSVDGGYIVCKYYRAGRGGHGDYALTITPGGNLKLIIAEDVTAKKYHHFTSQEIVPLNTWTHVGATFERGRMKLLIDGKVVAEKTSKILKRTDPDEYPNDDVTVGGLWNNGYIFNGAIDEVGIWNRALTADEIAAVAELPAELPAYLPRKDLVAFWMADGHAKDSVAKHHGTVQGNVKYTTGRHGKAKGAFGFDGKSGSVKIPDSAPLDTDKAFTLAAWINARAYTDHRGKTLAIFAKWYKGNFHADYILYVNPAGRLCLYVCAGPRKLDELYSKSVVLKNTWTHVAATFDAGTIKVYINGRLDGIKVSTRIKRLDPAEYKYDDVHIGALYNGGHAFNGALDDVGIWKRALTPDEIAAVAGPMAGMHVTRLPGVDRVEMSDSSILRGLIQNKQFTLATPFGKLVIPVGKVVGIVPAPRPKPVTTKPASNPAVTGSFVHLLLADGQVVTGQLSADSISLQVSWGSTLKIPIRDIRQCGYRVDKTKPESLDVSAPAVTLRSGHRLILGDKNLTIQFQAEWGKVALPIKSILRIEPGDWQSTRHKAYFANGSVLTGTLPQKLKLKLALGPELSVEPGQVWGIAGTAKPVKAAGATILLRSGDRLIGRFAGKMLTIKTASGDVKVHAGGITSMFFDAKKPTSVTLATWDNKTIKGTVTDTVVALEIVPGVLTLKVPAARIATVTQPGASPPPEMLKKIEKLIAQLGAESYVDREKAQKALIAMGKSIVPLLKKHLNNPDPEIRQRLEQIIKTLGG